MRFTLNREAFDSNVAAIRSDNPTGTHLDLLVEVVNGEDDGDDLFDPNAIPEYDAADPLDELMACLTERGVLIRPKRAPEAFIAAAVDREGYRQISVGGLTRGVGPFYVAGGCEKAWRHVGGDERGIDGAWAAADGAVVAANQILVDFAATAQQLLSTPCVALGGTR